MTRFAQANSVDEIKRFSGGDIAAGISWVSSMDSNKPQSVAYVVPTEPI